MCTGRQASADAARVPGRHDRSGRSGAVRTPSGGLHAYFPNTREQACWTCATAHVDFRSDGGYVLVPPSRVVYDEVTAGVYQVAAIASRVSAPVDGADLRAFLEPPRPRRAPAFTADAVGASDPERLAAWIAAHPEDGRKRRLFWAACRAVEAGHDLGPTLAPNG